MSFKGEKERQAEDESKDESFPEKEVPFAGDRCHDQGLGGLAGEALILEAVRLNALKTRQR